MVTRGATPAPISRSHGTRTNATPRRPRRQQQLICRLLNQLLTATSPPLKHPKFKTWSHKSKEPSSAVDLGATHPIW
ncbi:hypothetical protein GBA52_016301 [Prunus armeniaca]|nr:hypothetical protein GBA52_016301 [Prunus armeniaca]